MHKFLSRLLISAVLIGVSLGNVTPAQAQVYSDRLITITVNDLLAKDITEGDAWGLLGGKHDEPYFMVAWEISDAGNSANARQDGRVIKVPDLEEGQHARDIVLWQGSLKSQQHLHLTVRLMEDDGSGLRDAIGLPAIFVLAVLGGVEVSGEYSCNFGYCLDDDDFVGSFSIDSSFEGTYFQKDKCSKIEVDSSVQQHANIDLSCDGRYQLQVGAAHQGLTGTNFNLVAQHSGKCLDVKDVSQENGAVVQQWDCIGPQQPNQLWRLQQYGDAYNIIAVHSGKCLDLAAEQWETNGGKVQQWNCVGGGWTNQLWKLQMSGGVYQIIAHSGKCLDVSKASKKNKALVRQWDCRSSEQTNQLWTLQVIP